MRTSKISRVALTAGVAIGAVGLIVVPAAGALTTADNAISTPNYYVNSPMLGGTSKLTPESITVSGVIDTGGNPGSLLQVPAGGLTWNGSITIPSGGVPVAGDPFGNSVPIDGIPTSGSNSNVSISVTDAAQDATKPLITSVSNAGADNFSTVTFEYDTLADYTAAGNQPGPKTQFAPDVQVPTAPGLSPVSTTLGAFGQAAQNASGNKPLKPNTKYVYWFVQQPGGTDAATNINVAAWAAAPQNPTDECYPNVAIAKDKTLSSYTATTMITADGTSAAALQGQCVYYYGNASGALTYQSPVGRFTTPKIGKLTVGRSAQVSGRSATVSFANDSAYKASGSIALADKQGNQLASGKFAMKPGGSQKVTLKLTAAGVTAAKKGAAAAVTLSSDWDQKTGTKTIKLVQASGTGKKTKKKAK